MSPEKQRIAIAEACGWKFTHFEKFRPEGDSPFVDQISVPMGTSAEHLCSIPLPDYLNDLNAMHEAEKVLTDAQWDRYIYVSLASPHYGSLSTLARAWVSATAAQRAEAFLKTLNLWTEQI